MHNKRRRMLFVLLASALLSVAQSDPIVQVQDSARLTFAPDPDSQPRGYEVDIRDRFGRVVRSVAIGKPVPDLNGEITVDLDVRMLAYDQFTITARAVGNGNQSSQSSAPSNVWEHVR